MKAATNHYKLSAGDPHYKKRRSYRVSRKTFLKQKREWRLAVQKKKDFETKASKMKEPTVVINSSDGCTYEFFRLKGCVNMKKTRTLLDGSKYVTNTAIYPNSNQWKIVNNFVQGKRK